MPDIDIDFDDYGRQQVIDWVVEKYGKNQVAQIVTFGTMAAKSSIRDVARVLDLPLDESDRLAKLVPARPGTKFKNIFGIGDAAGLPTAKTGAAIRKQVPVVVENIKRLKAENLLSDKVYNGYSSCPIVTGYGKMVLAEFDYDNNFTPDPKLKRLLISDSSKELRRLWFLKKYGLPYLYWNKMLKGKEI